MFGFGIPELLVIGAILMLVFGVGKLPELGNSFGKAISNFRRAADGKDQVEINPKAES
ncbi:twin-arginine translocase TatA/TatE family subunit [Trichlorobacter lovleyi]|uniref:Sec-independent protein translocase protein TatA n=1 Tax=Trichlorobacter lovleyi (strain ATCC BAA-1151 / DSM 17278 / SZ) TaxID=398767 RepID=B3E7N0_TRIL1|nr:twin-arginine translocase TatA/TatE family subunit [Trichlorobacter lovleyi]ACD95012.1 sec-independent translocation protein mttA/Hcf106 [Trichlorobacter lovleyi SZ]